MTAAKAAGAARIVFLRHAETALNKDGRFRGRADPALTPEGDRQAASAARSVADLNPVVAYTSPRLRARQTLGGVQGAVSLETKVEAVLDDFDYGDWTGKTAEEAASGWPALFAIWQKDPSAVDFPQGESVRAAVDRIAAFLARVRQAHRGGTVLAVTHDAIIRCAVCVVLDVPLVAMHRIAVELVSTTALLTDPPRLLWLNRREGLRPRV